MSSKFDRQIKSLSPKQIALARRFQSADIASFSKAVKALAERDDQQIAIWKGQLDKFYDDHPEEATKVSW